MLQLLILLLTVLVTSSTKCPTMCICKHVPREIVPTNYLYYTVVRCHGINSSATLSNTTRVLEVSDLNGTSLDELVSILSESDLPELNSLALANSIVGNVSDLLVAAGEKIQFLSLTHNHLNEIPELSGNLTIISLDLSDNAIVTIPTNHSLQTIRTLEALNLSVNSIKQIKPNAFRFLSVLKFLDLSRNNLNFIGNRVFEPLLSLQYLNLSHNRIKVLQDKSFSSLAKLQQLDVSWNNLERTAPGSLQLPSLARLLLAGNIHLGDSEEVLVEVGQKLHTVDASRTGLKQVPPTLTRSIRTLKIGANRIKTVTCGELDAYPLLQFLDFTSNDLVLIEDDALGRLESLSVLYLSDNKLRSIPRSLPEELTVLHLERNIIERVSRDDLDGLSNLEVLLLNDNKITVVEGGAFSHLHSLVTLDLSRNSIKALYPGSLSGPLALQILRLSGIDTVSPAEDVSFPLSATDHLVSLDLSGSSGLARQLLADTAALAASRELQELDISGVDLEFIRSDLLHFLPQLRIMHIEDNRLNCTNLQWLAVWMRRQDQHEYRYITCATPPELWGTPILDLQVSEAYSTNRINHDRVQYTEGRETAQKKSPLGQYVIHKKANAKSSLKSNNFTDNYVNKTNEVHLENDESRVSNNKNVSNMHDLKLFTAGKKLNDDVEQVVTTKGPIKSVNKVLVSSADWKFSSLIRTPNEAAEYVTKRDRQRAQDLYQKDSPNTEATTNKGTLAEYLLQADNGSAEALNKTQASNSVEPNQRILNDTSGLPEGRGTQFLNELDISENTSDWNVSTVKTSMYRNVDSSIRLLHPGMLILAVGVLCCAATLATLAARFNIKKRRNDADDDSEDIPVTSISSVTELW